MAYQRNLKGEIIRLRVDENKSYREISSILNCSKSTVQYHCGKHNLVDTGKKRYPISPELSQRIKDYLKCHSVKETIYALGVSASTITKHTRNNKTTSKSNENGI